MRQLLILGFAVIGLQFGCGGDEADMGMQPDLASHEDRLLRCTTETYIVYYTDATYTTVAGTWRCECGRTPTRTGVETAFEVEQYSNECF